MIELERRCEICGCLLTYYEDDICFDCEEVLHAEDLMNECNYDYYY